jgi:hypothetical protein
LMISASSSPSNGKGPILEHHSLTGILHRSHQRHSLQPALVLPIPRLT